MPEGAEDEEMYCYWMVTISKKDGSTQRADVYTTGPAIVYMVRGRYFITDRPEKEVLEFFEQFTSDKKKQTIK